MERKYNEKTLMAAENQIKELTERFNLRPEILWYFKNGTISYSYTTPDVIGLNDIGEKQEYKNAVKEFEDKYASCCVYYAIVNYTPLGRVLSLLFVEDSKKPKRIRKDGDIYAYVVNLDAPEWSEFGTIRVTNYRDTGVLFRIE